MRRLLGLVVCGVAGLLLAGVSPAVAVTGGLGTPQWTVTAVSTPTNFAPGDESGDDLYRVIVENTGSAVSQGTVTISDVLPAGLTLDRGWCQGVRFEW